MISQPLAESNTLSILESGKSSFEQHLFKLVKSINIFLDHDHIREPGWVLELAYETCIQQSLDLCLNYCNLFVRHLAKLLLYRFCG
jgi:hypothetical protein